MLEIIDVIREKGNNACEDAIGFSHAHICVIDGASGLSGINVTDGLSDPAWFAQRVNALLAEKIHDPSLTIQQMLTQICNICLNEYLGFTEIHKLETPPDSPSASLSLLRVCGQSLEYYGLGDCVSVIEYKDNTSRVLHDDTISRFDNNVIKEMVRIHQESGISVLEARTRCNDLLIENRKKRNQPDGYWTLDIEGRGLAHATYEKLEYNQISSLSVFSDGFAQLVDVFHVFKTYEELHAAMKKTPLAELYRMLVAIQNRDPHANKYPRFKLRDDASCVIAKTKDDR